MHWAYTQLKSEAITTRSSARWSSHIHRMTAAYMLQLIYDIYTYTTKTWLSFCAHMNRCDAVNRLIFAFSDSFTCSAITHRAVTALYSHVELIYNIHIYTMKTRLSFCTHTDRRDAVNRPVFRIFRSIYMQRHHTQSSNSALFTH